MQQRLRRDARRRALRARSNRRDLQELREQTPVGEVFLRALMRRQLRLSLSVAGAFLVLIGLQPLVPELWPRYGDLSVLGVPLCWLVLGLASYPILVLLGRVYVHRAELIDDDFSDLVE